MRRFRTPLRALVMTAIAATAMTSCAGGDDRVIPLPDCLDLPTVYALMGPESLGLQQWDEAIPLAEELGSTEASTLPDDPIEIFGPGEESGTFDSFTELAIADFAEERGVPEEQALPRPDYTSSPNDNVIVDGVAGTSGSFGWIGHAFAKENEGVIRPFAVAPSGGRCVAPTDTAIAAGEYPLARDLFIYVNVDRAQEDDAVAAFVDSYLGDDGRQAVADAGYVSLRDPAWEETRAAWGEAGGSPGEPGPEVSGDVAISGSSTVEPISSLLAEQFSAAHPEAGVSVDGPGTGDGFELFCAGDIDIADASRPIEDEEAAACEAAGVSFVELKIGIDGLTLVTRSDPHE